MSFVSTTAQFRRDVLRSYQLLAPLNVVHRPSLPTPGNAGAVPPPPSHLANPWQEGTIKAPFTTSGFGRFSELHTGHHTWVSMDLTHSAHSRWKPPPFPHLLLLWVSGSWPLGALTTHSLGLKPGRPSWTSCFFSAPHPNTYQAHVLSQISLLIVLNSAPATTSWGKAPGPSACLQPGNGSGTHGRLCQPLLPGLQS